MPATDGFGDVRNCPLSLLAAATNRGVNRMHALPVAMALPRSLADVDAGFMTLLLRARGVISPTNSVVALDERDVGMTAGYFSAIKRVICAFAEPTDAPSSYVVKTWPEFEILPKEAIRAMFMKDIQAYQFPAEQFFPRAPALLADFDAENDRWALVMQDVEAFAEHKTHENELNLDEVLRMIPGLVDMAVAWEGCHEGAKATNLDGLGVGFWASEENLGIYRGVMPGGAKLFDKTTTMADSSLIGRPTWDEALGQGIAELFTNKIDAFYTPARPENGATCTLAHGDFRGDNIFFCTPTAAYPEGWLVIDFQLLFRGPVPSDLAYLMNSGSVLPSVYEGAGRETVLHAFYDRFMQRTTRYPDYTWDQFRDEFAMMSTVMFIYYVGMGAAFWQAGAFENARPLRVELGGRGATEADLAPDELRKRMWWTKTFRNFRANFAAFDQYSRLSSLPDNQGEMGPWAELPAHLR